MIRKQLRLVDLTRLMFYITLCINQTSLDFRYPGWIFRIFSGEGEIGSDDENHHLTE
jgi:hypothetical protein